MAVLFCEGGGDPAPTVRWFRLLPGPAAHGVPEEVISNDRVLISDSFLAFTEVRLSDEGFYFCTLSSPLGNATSNKALLNVYSK